MNITTLTYIIVAFAIGVMVGWITLIIPSGVRSSLTRADTQRLNELIARAMDIKRGFTITLFSEGELIDQVTVYNKWRR